MTPDELIDDLQALERQLGTSRVRAFFRDQSPKDRNEYSLLRGDVSYLLGELTVNRLESIAEKLDEHTDELKRRTSDLKDALDELATARKILNRFNKAIGIVGRVLMYLL